MTPQEAESAQKIAALTRTARKRRGLTQIDVAKKLGISQSLVSKIESGLLVPSAPHWFEFCDLTKISPESLRSGFLEQPASASLQGRELEADYKIPVSYRENRGSKIRAMLPFFHYLKQKTNEAAVQQYFKSIKMDSDVFVDLDFQINLKFCLDLARTLISRGELKPENFSDLAAPVSESWIHGRVSRAFEDKKNSIELLQQLISHAKHYECNFSYQVQDVKSNALTFSVKPEAHLRELPYRNDSELGDFLCRYKKHYFEQFSKYGGTGGAKFSEVECHFHGAEACVYEFRVT